MLYYFDSGQSDVPTCTSSRIVFITCYLTGVVLISAYSASLISHLTNQQLVLPFTTLQEMLKVRTYRFAVLDKSAQLNYFDVSTTGLFNELWSFSKLSVTSPTSQLILQPFRCFTYVTAHSPTLPFLHLHHSSFSNPSVASPTSQLILQPFRCFTYVTAHFQPFFRFSYVTSSSLTSPGEPPVFSGHKWLYHFIIYTFIYNFNWITKCNFTLISMPSRGRNCYSLLRLKLISTSPLLLGSNIVAFHPAGTNLIPDVILIYSWFLIVKVISIILISFIFYLYTLCMYAYK